MQPLPARGEHDDTVFVNGRILTMAGPLPEYADAVVTSNGRIAYVGQRDEAQRRYPAATVRDLQGRALLPGFVDPHSHFINALAMSTQVNVSAPPVGPCSTAEEIAAELRRAADDRGLKPGELFIGYGYDDTMMPADHLLTRDDLDPPFPDNPVLVIHVSLHGAVLNSAAMAQFGISAQTETPAGGVIVRREGSNEPQGLVMETAFLPIFASLPTPTPEEELKQIRSGQLIYAAAGVTTAQEGATHAAQIEVLQRGAEAGALFIDVVAYPFVTDMQAVLDANPPETFGTYRNGLKLGGIKITTDGSPQGRTAYFTTSYLTGGPAGEADWCGEPSFPQDFVNDTLAFCYSHGLQTLLHANGDAAIDMVLTAHAYAAGDDVAADRRTVVIHSQFVRRDQLERYAEYNLVPSLYTEHTFFFGQAHLENRGPEQSAYLSPLRDAIDLGLHPTNHTDFNVVPIDQMFVVWTAVNRPMRDGSVLGSEQRVTPYEALQAITINSARQHFEEHTKGSIQVGKLADLVVLSDDPTAVDPMAIKDITVLETIKQGATIYRAP